MGILKSLCGGGRFLVTDILQTLSFSGANQKKWRDYACWDDYTRGLSGITWITLLSRGTGERISYLATILLTEIMFLVIVTKIVPHTKDIPAIPFLFLEQTVMLAVVMIIVLLMDKI